MFFLSPLTISALALRLKLGPFEVGLTGSIGVFLGLEVEPPQRLGLLGAAKGCQMTASHNPVTPVGRRWAAGRARCACFWSPRGRPDDRTE